MADYTDPLDDSGERPSSEAEQAERDKIMAQFRRHLAASKGHSKDWRAEAKILYDTNAGHQWDPEDVAKMEEQGRPAVTFNVMGKFLDAVSGLQINNRQDIRYFPREPGDTQLNELLTGSVTWARDLCDMADEETDAFGDLVLTGMGWMEGYLDEDADPAGWPAGERRDPLEMYWDPAARKKNLRDGRYVIRVKGMDRAEYREQFGEDPGAMPELSSLSLDDDASPEIIHSPQDYDTGPGNTSAYDGAGGRGRVPVADYQYWTREKRWQVEAEGLGSKQFTEKEWQEVEPLLAAQGIPYRAAARSVKVYKRCIIDGSGIRKLEDSPYQEGFTYHAITGKRDRNTNTWYGIGRAVVDPQKWMNKFFSSILDIIMRNSKGGLLAEEGAFENPQQAREEWARPDSVTMLTEGALQKGKIQQKEIAGYPQGLDRLMQFTMDALPSTSGINLEMLGLVDRQQSGVLEAGRKQSAMAIIAWAFDSMRRYYRSMGRMMAVYIRDYVDEGTLVRIAGNNGQEQYVPLVKDKLALTFDIIVDEAPTSVNMKERTWAALGQLIPQAIQAGIRVPPEVLDYSPIPTDLSEKWKKMLEGDPQKAQEAEQKQQQQFEATLRKVLSEATKNEADAGLKQAQAQNLAGESDPAHRQLHQAEVAAGIENTQAKTATESARALELAARAGVAAAGG